MTFLQTPCFSEGPLLQDPGIAADRSAAGRPRRQTRAGHSIITIIIVITCIIIIIIIITINISSSRSSSSSSTTTTTTIIIIIISIISIISIIVIVVISVTIAGQKRGATRPEDATAAGSRSNFVWPRSKCMRSSSDLKVEVRICETVIKSGRFRSEFVKLSSNLEGGGCNL